jgi:adenine-specific DNA glycosylase
LDFLHGWDDDRAYRYLVGLPGVSRKTALCIMMYSLRRQVFPVDTHVWRVARRLGWTPARPKPSEPQERLLEAAIPAELRYTLHVNMMVHGRLVFLPYNPRCGACPLEDICPSRAQVDVTWVNWRRPRGVWAPRPVIADSNGPASVAPPGRAANSCVEARLASGRQCTDEPGPDP